MTALRRGQAALARGDLTAARAGFSSALEQDPALRDAWQGLATALARGGDRAGAIECWNLGLRLNPGWIDGWLALARALIDAGRLTLALTAYDRVLERDPRSLSALAGRGFCMRGVGRHAEALDAYERAASVAPENAGVLANLAALLEAANRLEDARAHASAAVEVAPTLGLARLILARCARRDGDLEAAWSHAAAAEPDADLLQEMARIRERQGRYDAAWALTREMNAAVARSDPGGPDGVDSETFPREISAIAAQVTPEWARGWPTVPPDPAPPVFVVGFNRSGTTLLHRILDSHPALSVMEERPCIDAVLKVLEGRDPAGLSARAILVLRDVYRGAAARFVSEGRVVDKTPLNTIHLGLIHRLFPEAPIIFSLRHPCDVIVSNLQQRYRHDDVGVQFESLPRTVHLYTAVMSLGLRLRALLPLRTLDVRYEALVTDWETETRRVLDFLDLPWDDTVRSHRARTEQTVVRTPSYHQVVQPIYRHAVGRWRHYGEHLAPHLPAVAPVAAALGYELIQRPAE